MKRRIVLCADDYGQAFAISQGIIHLIKHGRISATSCMVNLPHWLEHAAWLKPYQNQIDIGLHFNLTSGQPLSSGYAKRHGEHFFMLPTLLRQSLLRQLDLAAIEAECHAQIDRFRDTMGFLPHHIDGHQHIHQFPVIREAVVRVYEKRLRPQKTYVRLVNETIKARDLFFDTKKVIIQAMGAKSLKKLLERHNIPHNQSFAGIYAFGKANRYGQLFLSFLSRIEDKGLIMCHPGLASPEGADSLAKTRYSEYQYLAGRQFLADCRAQGISLQRAFIV